MPRSVRRNRCARVYGRSQSFFSYATLRTRSATCCAKPFSAFSNHPHLRSLEAASFVGGRRWQSIPFSRKRSRAARACCARHSVPRSRAFLKIRPIVEVMLNPDGRLWIDRLSSGLADTGERRVCSRRGAHRSVGRPSRRRRGSRRQPARLSRIARDGGALRGTVAARRSGSGLCYPQARGRRVHAGRLRRQRDHDLRPGRRFEGQPLQRARTSLSPAALPAARRR